MTENVYCHICGKEYDMCDPAITFWYVDGVWECREEEGCFARRAQTPEWTGCG